MVSKKKLLETPKPKKFLDIGCKKRLATLKKIASELAVLCNAICIMEGPTGEVDIWLPESQAHAVAIVAKYKESKKKPKLYEEANNQSTCKLVKFEEEKNEGLVMGNNCDVDSVEWFDTDEFLDKYFNNGKNNNGVIDHRDNVEGNKGCSNISSEIDQLPIYEDYNVGESWKRIFEEKFDISEVISTIGTNVEGDVKEDSGLDFGYLLGDIFRDTSNIVEVKFSDGSSISNVEIKREPAGYIDQGHQNYDVFGMWPTSDTVWQLPECSGLNGVYDLPIVPYEFYNKKSDDKPLLTYCQALDKQPELMDYIPTNLLREISEEN